MARSDHKALHGHSASLPVPRLAIILVAALLAWASVVALGLSSWNVFWAIAGR